jgi:hypothetical protein
MIYRSFQLIIDWLEVWALLIPVIVFMLIPKLPSYLRLVAVYVFIAFFINLFATISWKFKHSFNFPVVFQTNTYFYNIHSIVRLFLFGWFFILLDQPFLQRAKKIILLLFLVFIVINFMFEPFINYWYEDGKLQSTISHRILATEAAIMVFYCLQYYLYNLMHDEAVKRTPDFWIVTGLAIFSFCSFPIYFFYNAILLNYRIFTINIWVVQKISFLIFCLCIARALYISRKTQISVGKTKV